MLPERVEKLKSEYTDQYVVVDASRPELARFKGMVGQVRTINFNGRALVEFDAGENRGRYDVELDYLKVVEKPAPKPPPATAKPPVKKAAPKTESPSAETAEPPAEETEAPQQNLSALELARMKKDAAKTEEASRSAEAPQEKAAGDAPAD
jgi:hypothetical protein